MRFFFCFLILLIVVIVFEAILKLSFVSFVPFFFILGNVFVIIGDSKYFNWKSFGPLFLFVCLNFFFFFRFFFVLLEAGFMFKPKYDTSHGAALSNIYAFHRFYLYSRCDAFKTVNILVYINVC